MGPLLCDCMWRSTQCPAARSSTSSRHGMLKRAAAARSTFLWTYGLSTSAVPTVQGIGPADVKDVESLTIEELPLKQKGGIFVIPVQINGAITLEFVIDSGAADVQVPVDVFSTLICANTVTPSDLVGKRKYVLADGTNKDEPIFMIRELKIGRYILRDVAASVAPAAGELLLGQSFLSRFKEWTVDNNRHVIKLVQQSTGAARAPIVGESGRTEPMATAAAPSVPRRLQPPPRHAIVCGRPVEYTVDETTSGTGLLGVWIGNWNNVGRLCGGLIVEKIDPKGTAGLIYVYGPSQPGSKLAWKQQHRDGFLRSGELSFQDDEGATFTFHHAGYETLDATFVSRSGRLTARFANLR